MLLVFHTLWPKTAGFWARCSSQTCRCCPWCGPLHVVLMPLRWFNKNILKPVVMNRLLLEIWRVMSCNDLFFYMFRRPALHMFDKVLIKMSSEAGCKGTRRPGCWGVGGSGGRVGGVAAGGDMVGTRWGTPLTAAGNKCKGQMLSWFLWRNQLCFVITTSSNALCSKGNIWIFNPQAVVASQSPETKQSLAFVLLAINGWTQAAKLVSF